MELTPITENEFRKKLKGCGIKYYCKLPSNEIKALLGFCPTKKKNEITDETGSMIFESINQAAIECKIPNPSSIVYALNNKKTFNKKKI